MAVRNVSETWELQILAIANSLKQANGQEAHLVLAAAHGPVSTPGGTLRCHIKLA